MKWSGRVSVEFMKSHLQLSVRDKSCILKTLQGGTRHDSGRLSPYPLAFCSALELPLGEPPLPFGIRG